MKLLKSIICCIALLLVVSCKPKEQKRINHFTTNNVNKALTVAAIHQLHDGDLVLRRGRDMTSYIFSEINQKDKTFSHCGLVFFENGYPFVYHAIGGEENPNQTLKRDSIKSWFSYKTNQAIGIARFSMSKEGYVDLKEKVVQSYFEKKKFDNHFDLKTDDYVYCSEFVFKTMNKVFGNDTVFKTVEKLGRTYISVENLYHNARTKLVWQVWFK